MVKASLCGTAILLAVAASNTSFAYGEMNSFPLFAQESCDCQIQITPKKEKRLGFVSSVSSLFDSNVSLDTDNLSLGNPPSDEAGLQAGVLAGGYAHLIRSKKYRLISEASYKQSFFPDFQDFNFGTIHSELRNEYRTGPLSLGLPFAYEFSFLSASGFSQALQITPFARYAVGDHFLTQLRTFLSLDLFFQENINPEQNRDARNFQTELTQFFFINQGKRNFKVSYLFETNIADGSDWDYLSHTVTAGFTTPTFWKIGMTTFVEVNINKDFANVDSTTDIRRADTGIGFGVIVSRPLISFVSLGIQYRFIGNNSNTDPFKFSRQLAGLSLGVQL